MERNKDTPLITGLVVRQRGTELYWSREGRWDSRLSEAQRWSNPQDASACGRANHWPACVQVWLDGKDRVLEMRPLDLREGLPRPAGGE
jgi:hypothetical protein